jgi:hypothetical protein
MKIPKYKQSLEWQQFIELNNVCFLPHKSYINGMRERHVVHYPFARIIGRGDLYKTEIYSDFYKGHILVLCNLRPRVNGRTDVRPDIMALTKTGEILLVECKIRNKSENSAEKAISKLADAAKQLAYYANRLKIFALESGDNSWESWKNLYYNVYEKIHEFPSFTDILYNAFSLTEDSDQKKWIKRINNSIIKGNVKYGLAFNEINDHENYGYQEISNESLKRATTGWNFKLGPLAFLGVNHINETFNVKFIASQKKKIQKIKPILSQKSSKKLRPSKKFKDINIETIQKSFYQQIEQKSLDEVVKKIIMWSKGKFYTDFRMAGTYTRCVFVLYNTDTFWINSKGVIKFSKHNILKLKPFNDEKYYREFIERLPKIKELSTRPYISLSFLKSQNELKELLSTLEWFIDTISAIKH